MSNVGLVPSKDKQSEIRQLFTRDAVKKALAGVLPKHLTPERVVRILLIATTKEPLLLQCSKESMLLAVMQASALGLEIGGVMGHAYLIPFKQTATLIVGYRGMVELARRSGLVRAVEAAVVYPEDGFEHERGLNPKLVHRPALDAAYDQRKLIAAYAVARFTNGGSQFEVMTRPQIDAIKARSPTSGSGPWQTDFAEMAKKSAVRKLAKLLPMSPEMAAAIELDNRAETGGVVTFSELLDVEPPALDAKEPSRLTEARSKVSAQAAAAREQEAEAAEAEAALGGRDKEGA